MAVLGSFSGHFRVLLGAFWCLGGLLKVLSSSFRGRFLVVMDGFVMFVVASSSCSSLRAR